MLLKDRSFGNIATDAFIIFLILCMTVTMFTSTELSAAEDSKPYRVLYINSYEKGYKWSDDITDSIMATFSVSEFNVSVDVEYMTTHLIDTPEYYYDTYVLFKHKYETADFDLIITSDDAAYNFMSQFGDKLFPDVPKLFCGVNYFDQEKFNKSGYVSGVVEHSDIEATIETALSLHPGTENIYYINDNSVTGLAIQRSFDAAMASFENINFIPFDFESFDRSKKADLLDNSILFFLIYTLDTKGTIYQYRYASKEISNYLDVPIYGQWDFSLGHGIIGGNLTSGTDQGSRVAELAIRLLSGDELSEADINQQMTRNYIFDYTEMRQFDLTPNQLPEGSRIINYYREDVYEVLILHSYHQGLKLTDDMGSGIVDALESSGVSLNITREYMDTKNNSHRNYFYDLDRFLFNKLSDKTYDIVITVNDNAYNFVNRHRNVLFQDSQVVFCGVNKTLDGLSNGSTPTENITGLLESVSITKTLESIETLFPDTEEVIIINDNTTTGKHNHELIDVALAEADYPWAYKLWNDMNMSDLQTNLRDLQEGQVILLLSYTEDRSNNNYTYDDSIHMIHEASPVPIMGVWDFYLGNGLLGGYLMRSYEHGYNTGMIARSVIEGTPVSDIPIKVDDVNSYMFDQEQLQRFGLSTFDLPPDSIVINKPFDLTLFIKENRNVILSSAIIMLLILVSAMVLILMLLRRNIKIKAELAEKERVYARTDMLTGLANRRAGILELDDCIKNYEVNRPLTICFIDLNNLKVINDTYGHAEGDIALKSLSDLFIKSLPESHHICRLGGDEFLIIMPLTNETQAKNHIQSIRISLSEHSITLMKDYILEISVGVREYDPEDHPGVDHLIEEADQLMYEDKMTMKGKR